MAIFFILNPSMMTMTMDDPDVRVYGANYTAEAAIRPKKEEVHIMECENCGQSLDRGVLVLPWEDGDNPLAYVRCPHCGHCNTVYGFGEDDD